ncbi:unnamed protein product [Fraxinus pennsylvanica]|uniref:Uncharacterized protein n=1 Tax=Fraxinus pennsylvanica TaxID=56036 RepID=A0AAD2A6X7_9LAMI|nr:unnamed protein product [Fraxinus pennsylvanica]
MSQPVGDLCDKAVQPGLDAKATNDLLELQSALAEKSNQLADAETKLQVLTEEVSKLGSELEISQKLLDESQVCRGPVPRGLENHRYLKPTLPITFALDNNLHEGMTPLTADPHRPPETRKGVVIDEMLRGVAILFRNSG